ncbi:MAG: ATP-binding protein [Planctomycetota bacterium]
METSERAAAESVADEPAAVEAFDASEAALEAARSRLRAVLEARAVGEHARLAVDLAMEELSGNAIRHGFVGGSGRLEVLLWIRPDIVELELADDGPPFDPTVVAAASPPLSLESAEVGGRGIAMVRALIETWGYRRQAGWNRLRLEIPRGRQAVEEEAPSLTIVVACGLDEECLGLDPRVLAGRGSVGESGIERLVGSGRASGTGPLVRFLAAVAEASDGGAPLAPVFLARPSSAAEGRARFATPFVELAGRAEVLLGDPSRPPLDVLRRVAERALAVRASDVRDLARMRYLVVGTHTEETVLAVALLARLALPAERVAVPAPLVASAIPEAHHAALLHTLPAHGVEVLLDANAVAAYCGLDGSHATVDDERPCAIEPADLRARLAPTERAIVERICMDWTRVQLRPLTGGFSGSLLLLAEGWRGEARTEPMVLKIDEFGALRRELAGYHQVKDLLGKHVPAFGFPVAIDERLGVGMELAAIEGEPETLQDTFGRADDQRGLARFERRLGRMLELLARRLFSNTKRREWVVPYRDFGLHTAKQQRYLRANIEHIHAHLAQAGVESPHLSIDRLVQAFAALTSNERGLEGTTSLVHGDLNYANVIGDQADNLWLIDWTHCARRPIEIDFAKLENDLLHVLDNALEFEDLPRAQAFVDYLIAEQLPEDVDGLPASLGFVRWDLRFRRLLRSVRAIRKVAFDPEIGGNWLVYRVALLRYATHTLSFDAARGRGECGPVQLSGALHVVEELVFELFGDALHLHIPLERPDSYPARELLSIDEAPWSVALPDYAPPYHVDRLVLNHAGPGGWADPEDLQDLRGGLEQRTAVPRDDYGRPLNPAGRTGIAGRGLLGQWGPNLSVTGVLLRETEDGTLEVLLGSAGSDARPELPRGFVLPSEDPSAGVRRVMRRETGLELEGFEELIAASYAFDARQTDHAWVEAQVFLAFARTDPAATSPEPGGEFDNVRWWPLDPSTINRLDSTAAGFLRTAIRSLASDGRMDAASSEQLLTRTGETDA